MNHSFDIAVIGGGHAGIEAANIACQFGLQVALFSLPDIPLASPPCNPAVGGVAKGHLVREVDALGGLIGKLADYAGIQYRTLNSSKGFAVQSTRVQIDKNIYAEKATHELEKIENLQIILEEITEISFGENQFIVQSAQGNFRAKKVIVTVGTFLDGMLHFGPKKIEGGRIDSPSTTSLKKLLPAAKALPRKFKTGTPPRIFKRSIDFSKLITQKSDSQTQCFHYENNSYERFRPQVNCYLAHTNAQAMKIIRDNLDKSPMFNGQIDAVGIRYCPSIEDKANRYPDRDIHHIFVEPETEDEYTYYPSGLSSSLPEEIQRDFIQSIEGLEKAEFLHPGYAVEYDVIDTTTLRQSLEFKDCSGLYFAGQVNGTSGYEEAAGQGLVAGINASLSLQGLPALEFSRHDSYIGVMIEDLTSNVRDEPYRLFTARSENRLFLREDNAMFRMASYRKSMFLSGKLDSFLDDYLYQTELLLKMVQNFYYNDVEKIFAKHNGPVVDGTSKRISLFELLKQAWLNPVEVLSQELSSMGISFESAVVRSVAIAIKYDGYIGKSKELLTRMRKLDSARLDWQELAKSKNISFECRQRIERIRPTTFGQLRNIEGIRPATLALVASTKGNL